MKDKPRQERRMGRNRMDRIGMVRVGRNRCGWYVKNQIKRPESDWLNKELWYKDKSTLFFFLLTTWSVCCMMHLSGPVLSLFMAAFPYHNCDNNNNNNNKNKTIKPVQQLALFWWLMWNVHEKVLALLLPYNMH